jgi:hypothetical protein
MNRVDGIFCYVTIHERNVLNEAGHGIDLSIKKGLVSQDEGFAVRRSRVWDFTMSGRQTRQGSAAAGARGGLRLHECLEMKY